MNIPEETTSIHIKMLGGSYFIPQLVSRNEKNHKVEEQSKELIKHKVIGNYTDINGQKNDADYFGSIDLYMTSSYEKEHRFEILENEIKKEGNFLDIGVGKGELTKLIAKDFTKITVVETSEEALSSIPNNLGIVNASVTKICASILDHNIAEKQDLILLSHTLYHIEDKFRVQLIKTLYKSLNPGGKIVIVYNDGLGRDELVNSFGGDSDSFGGFLLKTLSLYGKNAYALQSTEIMNTISLDAALNLADLTFSDASITAPREEVASYLDNNCFNGTHYQLESIQNFIFIQNPDYDQ
jgi:SAM-dependent methyltransferase